MLDCPFSSRLPEDLLRRLKETAEGFQRAGAAFWPGADHFLLLEIDADGSCTGDARGVCRCCVREAAGLVAESLARQGGTGLDLVGDIGPRDGPCCLCGSGPGD